MAAIDDLTKAVVDMTTAVGDAVKEIQTLAAALTSAGTNDPAVESAAQSLETLATNLEAAVTTATTPPAVAAAVNPPKPVTTP